MMNIKKTPALIATIVGMAFAGSALASDGTLTIEGYITDTTCSVDINGQGNNAIIKLPNVSANTLATAGDTAGITAYSITLSKCSGTTLSEARTFYEAGANTDEATGRLNTNIDNVQIELLNANQYPIMAGTGAEPNYQNDIPVDITGGEGTLKYFARYYATGQAGTGSLTTSVDYSIAYD